MDEVGVGLGLGLMAVGVIGLVITSRPWESGRDESASATTRRVGCDVLEISATRGDPPSIDDELAALQPKLSAFSSWNRFRLVTKAHREVAGERGRPTALAIGAAATATVEVIDASRLRIAVGFDDANGKRQPGNASTAARGRTVIYGHTLPDQGGHLLALRCE